MTKTKLMALLCAAAALLLPSTASHAETDGVWAKDNWQFRLRAIGVLPDEDSTVNIGGKASVGDAFVPEFDISYFFTDHIAAELILATAQHQVNYTGDINLGDTMILPPTLTLQYHFMPDSNFSPYIGAGLNYSIFYSEDSGTGFTDLDIDGGLGYALQAGFDYWLNDNWGINMDVKKIYLDIDAELNSGSIRADVDLDPWVVGTGVSYRF
ncbi:MAG: OmpW family protein [Micavibrio aeruginosavorus]|uniref:OmpW family protein n=1 Tax=Micavibrio aeruginosavorus TaxID=349221 RepID=A0A7T5UHB0_9BACT|nr:MAG: OmpW family protein [Micavibrio aeruginosavorus]